MPNVMKNSQPARYGVESGLKVLMYSRVHCAAGQGSECREAKDGESGVSAAFALPRTRLRAFRQDTCRSAMTLAALLLLLLTLTSGTARAEEPLRDPTRPYSAAPDARAASPRFVVNAIIISPERRVAIVNGRRVAVGGSIAGATVVAIEKDQLTLDVGGKRITAGLNDETTDR